MCAICEAALRLVVEHHDELRAIVGFTAHGLVRDNDRGPRRCSGRDAIEYLLRQGDAVERVLGIVGIRTLLRPSVLGRSGDSSPKKRGPDQCAPVIFLAILVSEG